MKKFLILCVALTFTACMSKEVKVGDPNLHLKGTKLYYKEKLFTGTLVQKVPLTEDKFIKIQYKDGVITSNKKN
ncbi:hypothetical protein [Fusobacterium sp. MFO224]|uniref:hypothetical protein n=1 Tax=Fusobacterium sp. MFO224 TaxID=3378070 RepID=UPI003853AA7A